MAKKQEAAKVIIDEQYYFTIDGRSMTLFKFGSEAPIGYYTDYVPMMRRIIYLNALDNDAVKKTQGVPFAEYIKILQKERARIEAIFKGILPPSGRIDLGDI